MARHHRRRRVTALVALAAVVVVLLLALLGGGTQGSTPSAVQQQPSAGFLGRLRELAGNGPGSFAASEQVAENQAIDRTLAYTPYVRLAGAQHRELALTFDDGPGPYTPRILSILEHNNVPATFFEVGVEERYFHASTSQMVAHDFPIGDHTELHAPMSHLSAEQQQAEIVQAAQRIGQYGAPFPRLFRPPYGFWDSTTLSLLRNYRMLMVLWTVDTSDYREPGVQTIVRRAVSGARPGAIILLHDAGGNRLETLEALPRIIAALRARHYRLVTVPKLLLDNPAPPNQQISAVVGSGG